MPKPSCVECWVERKFHHQCSAELRLKLTRFTKESWTSARHAEDRLTSMLSRIPTVVTLEKYRAISWNQFRPLTDSDNFFWWNSLSRIHTSSKAWHAQLNTTGKLMVDIMLTVSANFGLEACYRCAKSETDINCRSRQASSLCGREADSSFDSYISSEVLGVYLISREPSDYQPAAQCWVVGFTVNMLSSDRVCCHPAVERWQ